MRLKGVVGFGPGAKRIGEIQSRGNLRRTIWGAPGAEQGQLSAPKFCMMLWKSGEHVTVVQQFDLKRSGTQRM